MGRNRNKQKQPDRRQQEHRQQGQRQSPRQLDLEEAIAMQAPEPKAPEKPQERLEPVLLTVPQAAQLLNLSRPTVDRLAAAGKLPGRMKIGGQVRYHLPTLLAWLKDQSKNEGSGAANS